MRSDYTPTLKKQRLVLLALFCRASGVAAADGGCSDLADANRLLRQQLMECTLLVEDLRLKLGSLQQENSALRQTALSRGYELDGSLTMVDRSTAGTRERRRENELPSNYSDYSVHCYRAGSSFSDASCGCLEKPKSAVFDSFVLRPTIKIIAGSRYVPDVWLRDR